MNPCCVITTINPPTKAIERFHELFGSDLIVVGDKKTPADWSYKNTSYIPRNGSSEYALFNHYSAKNIGYMEAIKRKAPFIYDTDDDNAPNENWNIRSIEVEAHEGLFNKWFNVYDLLSTSRIWPRGFPLNHTKVRPDAGSINKFVSPIQQGLANGNPDVDAIWRLTIQKGEHYFYDQMSIYLGRGIWCPFNSQSTWWFPVAYPLLYLPLYATFRMTDIWRSFVAQRCLWELDMGVAFHSPAEVYQERNEHDLMKDFEDEIPGYLNNERIVNILSKLELQKGEENIAKNMLSCYTELIHAGVFPRDEYYSLSAWLHDYEKFK